MSDEIFNIYLQKKIYNEKSVDERILLILCWEKSKNNDNYISRIPKDIIILICEYLEIPKRWIIYQKMKIELKSILKKSINLLKSLEYFNNEWISSLLNDEVSNKDIKSIINRSFLLRWLRNEKEYFKDICNINTIEFPKISKKIDLNILNDLKLEYIDNKENDTMANALSECSYGDFRSASGNKVPNANFVGIGAQAHNVGYGNSELSEIFSYLDMYKNRITINLYDLFKIKYDFTNKNSFYRNLAFGFVKELDSKMSE